MYVNGQPCAPRKKEVLHENISFGCKPDELLTVEVALKLEKKFIEYVVVSLKLNLEKLFLMLFKIRLIKG